MKYVGGIVVVAVVAAAGYGIYEATKPTPTPTPTPTTPTPTPTTPTPPPVKKETIKIASISGWTPCEIGPGITEKFPPYAKEKLGVDVDLIWDGVPWGAALERTTTILAARDPTFDIIFSDSQWIGTYAVPGHIIELSDFIKADPELKAIIDDFYWEHRNYYMTYPFGSEHYWGLPMEGDDLVLYVRMDLLKDPEEQADFKKKYGWELPSTYEDFKDIDWSKYEQICEFFTRPPGLYGLAMEYSKDYDFISCHVMSFIWSHGGDIIDWDTYEVEGVVNSPEAVEALEHYKAVLKYQPPGASTYGIDECVTAMAQGKVFSTLTWGAVGYPIFDPKTSIVHDKTIAVQCPSIIGKDGKTRRIYCIGGQPWVVSTYTDTSKDLIFEFLKWWYSEPTQWEFAEKGGMPVIKRVIDSDRYLTMHPYSKAYKDMITGARDFWHFPEYAEMLLVFQEEWHAYCAGETKDAKTAQDKVARRQTEILKRAGYLKG